MKEILNEWKKYLLIKESLKPSPIKFNYLYHGTSAKRAKKIEQDGFSLKVAGEKSNFKMPGISTSVDKDVAEDHARWAAEKFKDKPKVITLYTNNLDIAPGSFYFSKWDELGSSEESIKYIKNLNEYDGVALFDPETGDGVEEYEVLIFEPKKLENMPK